MELTEFLSQSKSVIDLSQYDEIIAIGDVNCNIRQLIKILQKLRICDEDANWIANRTILVQTGNMISKHLTISSKQTIELFIKFRAQAPQYDSLSLGVLGTNELYHLHHHITIGSLSSATLKRLLNSANRWLSSRHSIGKYLRSLPLARVIGKSLFINDVNTLIMNHDSLYSMDCINTKIKLYFTHEFGDGSLFRKLFNPVAELHKMPSCPMLDKILFQEGVQRVIEGGALKYDIESNDACNGKLLSTNCGISGGGFGAFLIDLATDNVYAQTTTRSKQYVKQVMEPNPLIQLFGDVLSPARSLTKFSEIPLMNDLDISVIDASISSGPHASLWKD